MIGNIESKKSSTSKLKTELNGIESETNSLKKQYGEHNNKLKVGIQFVCLLILTFILFRQLPMP